MNNKDKECYENPFVYGLINTPANNSWWWENDYDLYDHDETLADAFEFIWSQLEDEDDDCDRNVRVFEEYVRNNRQPYRWEVDFQYMAQTLADLFSYADGEAFYI